MRKPEAPDTTPQAVQACHELILWMIPQLDKFPCAAFHAGRAA